MMLLSDTEKHVCVAMVLNCLIIRITLSGSFPKNGILL